MKCILLLFGSLKLSLFVANKDGHAGILLIMPPVPDEVLDSRQLDSEGSENGGGRIFSILILLRLCVVEAVPAVICTCLGFICMHGTDFERRRELLCCLTFSFFLICMWCVVVSRMDLGKKIGTSSFVLSIMPRDPFAGVGGGESDDE